MDNVRIAGVEQQLAELRRRDPDHQYMTTAEVASLLRLSQETVRFWRHAGRGPANFRVGRRVLYERAVVMEWIATRQEAAA